MGMPLSRDPARPLTSREIAKAVSGLLGGLAAWCDPEEIDRAMEHFQQNRALYLGTWREVNKQAAAAAKGWTQG